LVGPILTLVKNTDFDWMLKHDNYIMHFRPHLS